MFYFTSKMMLATLKIMAIVENVNFSSFASSWLPVSFNGLTLYSRVLLEKLTVTQLVKNFPAFHGTWRFITASTRASHWSLSWATCIKFRNPV